MRYRIFLCIIYCLGFYSSYSYSDSTITSKDFKTLIGCWEGSLTYLDYTTNKPFTMPANIIVNRFNNSNIITYSQIYPREPSANSTDSFFISKDGRFLNNEMVKTKRALGKDTLQIVTEITGIDGNDNKPAIIRHTYLLGKNTYAVKKEVQFLGQIQWILRNESRFARIKPCR